MREYSYIVEDRSLVKGMFASLINAFVNKLPRRLPANFITIASYGFVIGALGTVFYLEPTPILSSILLIFFLVGNLLLDLLDGPHARNTGTQSAIGEYLDHAFDLFVQGSLVLILWKVFDFTIAIMPIVVVVLLAILNAALYYEQYKSNILVRGKWGSYEGRLLSVILVSLTLVRPVGGSSDVLGMGFLDMCFGVLALVLIVKILKAWGRIPHITYGFWLFVGFLIIIASLTYYLTSPLWAVVVSLLYGGSYVCKVMQTQLTDGVERSPGFFVPLILLIQAFTQYLPMVYLLYIITLYLIFNVLLATLQVFKVLKEERRRGNLDISE